VPSPSTSYITPPTQEACHKPHPTRSDLEPVTRPTTGLLLDLTTRDIGKPWLYRLVLLDERLAVAANAAAAEFRVEALRQDAVGPKGVEPSLAGT
jgi:hypothetical protein